MTRAARSNVKRGHLAHRRRAPISPHGRRRRRGERGYTLVMTSLLLIPLMGFTALAVDVGGWYARAAQLQRAADAAALAGAARMPDFDSAEDVALETAEKNGFIDGGDISIQVERAGERRVNVTVGDADVARYFSSLFVDNITLTRDSLAEFVLPVPLGSPENTFGNDPAPASGSPVEVGLWGNIHGETTTNTKGDRYAAGCRGGDGCATQQNDEYRGDYWYAVDVPPNTSFLAEVYDAGLFQKADQQTDTGDVDWDNSSTFVSRFEMYSDPNRTPGDYDDAVLLDPCAYGTPGQLEIDEGVGAGTYESQWTPLCLFRNNSSTEQRYWLKASTKDNASAGADRYALRVRTFPSGAPAARISGFGDMSMFNNDLNTDPEFFLAKVAPLHRGKQFIVNLYDPGEIGVPNAQMEIRTPDGSPAPSCDVRVYDNPTDPSPKNTFSESPCSIATTNGSGNGLYNGELLSIQMAIPTEYSCDTTGDPTGTASCWWKVRYDLGGSTSGTPQDTTTWSAAILGDPVHLVEEDEDVAGA